MELRQLRGFAEVVRSGTFRAAAARVHLSQPALWQSVRALEEELGVPLFERAGRRVRVTRAGAQLFERAEAVLGAAERMHDLARELAAGRQGIVSLATPAPPVQLALAEAIGSFSRRHPEVRIEIHDLVTSPIAALRDGTVDLAVAPRDRQLEGVRLFEAHVVLVVPPDHRLAKRKRVDVRDLSGEALLTSPAGSLSRELLDRACRRAGLTPHVRMTSPSPGMLYALAQSGFGAAVLASDAAIGCGARPSPLLADRKTLLATEAWLQWRSRDDLAPAARLFVDHVIASRAAEA